MLHSKPDSAEVSSEIAVSVLTRERLTGDLARWLPNGAIDFIGRLDNQARSWCLVGPSLRTVS